MRTDFGVFCYEQNRKYGRKNVQLHQVFIDAFTMNKWGFLKAFRGSAKTMYTCYYHLFSALKKNRYQVYCSSNLFQTRDGMEKMRRIILNTPFMLDEIERPVNQNLGRNRIEFQNGSIIQGRTFSSNLRGGGNEEVRITLFTGDDIYPDRLRMSLQDYEGIWCEAIEKAIEPDEQLFLVGTPIDVNDLFARLERDPVYTAKIKIPAIIRNEKGEELSAWPERFPLEKLKRDQRRNPIAFARQMLVDPVPPEGIDFKTKWLKYYNHPFRDTADDFHYALVDMAVSAEETADYAGILDVWHRGHEWYIEGAWGIRGIDAIGRHLLLLDGLQLYDLILVEAPGSLHLLCKRDPNFTKLGGRVQYVTSVQGNKLERIWLLRPWFLGGFVHLREGRCSIFETEYAGFPKAHHLHCLDALQMGIAHLGSRTGSEEEMFKQFEV